MMNKTVQLGYGVLLPTLEQQANEQGYTLGTKAGNLEKSRQAITWLEFKDILTDSQTSKAFGRLNKQVVSALMPLEGGPHDE